MNEEENYLKTIAEQLTISNELKSQANELEKMRLENDLAFNRMLTNFTVTWQNDNDGDKVKSKLDELENKSANIESPYWSPNKYYITGDKFIYEDKLYWVFNLIKLSLIGYLMKHQLCMN